MRITGRQLRRIIQEEVERMINEEDMPGVPAPTQGTPAAAGGGAIESMLKEKSNITGVSSMGTDAVIPYSTTPVSGVLQWSVGTRGTGQQAILASLVTLNAPVTSGAESVNRFLIRGSYGFGPTDTKLNYPQGYSPLNTDYTRKGVLPPDGVTVSPGQKFNVPVKVSFGTDSDGDTNYVIYKITPA